MFAAFEQFLGGTLGICSAGKTVEGKGALGWCREDIQLTVAWNGKAARREENCCCNIRMPRFVSVCRLPTKSRRSAVSGISSQSLSVGPG